jgi:competence protein ComGC
MKNYYGVKPFTLSLFFFFFLGLVMLLFGILFLVLSPRVVDHRVKEYNRKVEMWTNEYRSEFQMYNFSMTVLDTQFNPDFPFLPYHKKNFALVEDTTVCFILNLFLLYF